MPIKTAEKTKLASQKTTSEIRALLINAKLDFDSVENKALNDNLPRIFHGCPCKRVVHDKTMRRRRSLSKTAQINESKDEA